MEKDAFSVGFKLDEAEIAGYICSKKETEARKLMWEFLHKDYLNEKRYGRSVKSKKKIPPTKKAMKVSADQRETKKTMERMSSKINYDALKKLMEEDEDSDEKSTTGNQIGGDSKSNVSDDDNQQFGDDDFDF